MLAWLRQRETLRRNARSLYGSIVTQARTPPIYRTLGVPDSNEGRFEAITLHMALALRRLGKEGEPGHKLGRTLTETFVIDLDDTFREMTVGDLAVPRHVKRAVSVLYERHTTLSAAIDGARGETVENTVQTALAGLPGAESLDVAALSSYITEAAEMLDRQSGSAVLDGQLAWPEVHARSVGETGADGRRQP